MSVPAYPEYKDSGVPWLGRVPRHWEVMHSRRMFSVRSEPAFADDQMLTASQKYGVLFQSDFIKREGRRVVEVILGKENLKHVEPDDFIISMRSFQGGLEWCRLRGSTSFHYVMITPIKHVHPPFFAHLFKSTTYIQALRATTDLIRDGQELRYSNFVQVPLPVVPFEEQAAIAIFLDRETAKIDALVAEQERLIALLKEKRQAVISHAVTKGLNPQAPMQDSGIEWLGEIPAHWEMAAIKWMIDDHRPITYGIVQAGPDTPGGIPYIRPVDMTPENGVADLENIQRTTEEIAEAYERSVIRTGDLVCSIGPSFGKVMIVPEELDGGNLTQGTARLAPAADIEPRFLFWILRSNESVAQWESSIGGATFRALNLAPLANTLACLPPKSEQTAIAVFLGAETKKFDTLISEAQAAITLLQERRTALISAAVTGKIDVRGLVDAPAELELA